MGIDATQRVYSNDKQLWVGMNIKDAYQDEELTKIFIFADKNGDNTLDEAEITRYNSPILKSSLGDETEYYAGLKLEEVKSEGKELFSYMDNAPRDGVLSDNELKAGVDEIKSIKNRHTTLVTGCAAAFTTIIGGIMGGKKGALAGLAVGGVLGFAWAKITQAFVSTNADIVKE